VVVVVDEYDKPIIDNLEEEAEARRIREVLRGALRNRGVLARLP
jgi:hypothetical protein